MQPYINRIFNRIGKTLEVILNEIAVLAAKWSHLTPSEGTHIPNATQVTMLLSELYTDILPTPDFQGK